MDVTWRQRDEEEELQPPPERKVSSLFLAMTEMCHKVCKYETKHINLAACILWESAAAQSVHTVSIKERDPDTVWASVSYF